MHSFWPFCGPPEQNLFICGRALFSHVTRVQHQLPLLLCTMRYECFWVGQESHTDRGRPSNGSGSGGIKAVVGQAVIEQGVIMDLGLHVGAVL
jgi:hypothetical protein